MRNLRKLQFFIILVLAGSSLAAQKIVYSEPEREDNRRINFDIIGKVGGNFLVYKNNRNDSYICVYDNNMKMIERVKHEYLPDERMVNIDFFPYSDFSYMIYQYYKRGIVHCAWVKIDGNGKKISDPVEIDTTHVGIAGDTKIYTALSSEDKGKIILFKINSKNKSKFYITTKLFDDKMELLKKTQLVMPMDERNDYLGEFLLDNEGHLVFTKFYRNNSDNVNQAYLVTKRAMEDSFTYYTLHLDKIYLDEIRVKIDNYSKRYFINSFYYKQKRGNIEGMYFYVRDNKSNSVLSEKTVDFSDELRQEAKSNSSTKTAFNDYFIRNVITKADGGFIIGAESFYSTSRSGIWDRYNYLYGSPSLYAYDYYFYYPYSSSYWWRSRYNNYGNVRYHADNIIILSYDREGNLEWNNVIKKEQFDDNSDDKISYQIMNTGGALHFLFNSPEKRGLFLTDFSLLPGGDISRNPTLKNLDKGYEFMAKYAKQVSSKQIIIPCLYRSNYICFAKLEYN